MPLWAASTPAFAGAPSLSLTPSNPVLIKGLSLNFQALLGSEQENKTSDVNSWTSSNPAVASIDSSGRALALSAGATTITAVVGNQKGSTTLTVITVSNPIFTVQPSNTGVSAAITPAVKVLVQDNRGLPIAGLQVTMGIGTNGGEGGTGVLSGTLSHTTDATGIASFADLRIDWLGTAYTLVATVATPTGPLSSTSSRFDENPVNPCLASVPVCGTATSHGCTDSDGDGLSDAWESAGGIDFNGDGIVSRSEQVLTNVDPFFPDGTANPFPSADPAVKDLFLKYDWMELADQLGACTVDPLPAGPPNFLSVFYPFHSNSCSFDQKCISGTCRGHSDEPTAASLQLVVDAFSRRGVRLHLVRGHAISHANVTAYGPPIAACVTDLSGYTFSGAQSVNFYDLKTANLNASYNDQAFSKAQLFPVYHYAVFGHRHTCDSFQDCAKAACQNPDTGRNPLFNETGLAEQPGNDVMVTMGGFADRNLAVTRLAQGGTFMHELGHNLALDHGGPIFIAGVAVGGNEKLNFKPNYISVMNYNHQTLGVSTAASTCAPNDYACQTTPVSTRIDYSSFCPKEQPFCDASLKTVPNILDENDGTEAAGINVGHGDIGYTSCNGVQTRIPGSGPVDFNCNGNARETWCAVGCDITPGFELNKDPQGGGQIPNGTPGSGDALQPFEDWPNLVFAFQCSSTFSDGAVPGNLLSSGELTTDQIIAQAGSHGQRSPDRGLFASMTNPRPTPTRSWPWLPTREAGADLKIGAGAAGYSLGRDDAPVTLVEFSDYQCPFCRRFNAKTFAELKKNYIDTGKLRFISRDLPLSFHSNALWAAEAARCAGDQGRFWEYRDLLFSSAALDQGTLASYGQTLGLNIQDFDTCLETNKYKAAVEQDVIEGKQAGVSATPTFFINAVRLTGAQLATAFEAIIERQLAATKENKK